jgi:uncharacterized Fe-S cluster protein YjdI
MSEKTYTKGDLTVLWRQDRCIHSAKCVSGLSAVFDPNRRPWIDLSAAEDAAIVAQVEQCPTGALAWRREAAAAAPTAAEPAKPMPAAAVSASAVSVEIQPNGPLIVRGAHAATAADGSTEVRPGPTAYCRCGASARKPYCDGTHTRIGFKG